MVQQNQRKSPATGQIHWETLLGPCWSANPPHFQHVSVRPSVLIPAVSTSFQQVAENEVAYDRETSLLF